MRPGVVLKSVAIYYVKAGFSIAAGCGVLLLLYGPIQMPLSRWVLNILAVLTLGYLPTLVRLLRETEAEDQASGLCRRRSPGMPKPDGR